MKDSVKDVKKKVKVVYKPIKNKQARQHKSCLVHKSYTLRKPMASMKKKMFEDRKRYFN